jgi:NAD(P)-dependent dehydrogenase (short-subunit alcohol dehydrogenase family)
MPRTRDRAIARFTDVSDETQVEGAMRAAHAAFGSLDIVVNCAGFGVVTPLTELTGDKWKAVQAVTLGGVFYGVKHAARQMLDQGRPGVIINISSVNARQPGEGQVAYCAAKAGVDMITRCGALELGGRGIRVVGIAPGLVETPLTRKELEDPAMREALPWHHPDEAPCRSGRNCCRGRVSRVRPRPIDQR